MVRRDGSDMPAGAARMMDDDQLKLMIMLELSRHRGADKAIGMGELYERVYGKAYRHRINDTRPLRTLIDELQMKGNAILSNGQGYFMAATTAERDANVEARLERAARRKFVKAAKLKKVNIGDEFSRQLELALSEEG